MKLAYQTRKVTRAVAEVAPARDILDSNPKSSKRGKKEEDDNVNLESKKKREKDIAGSTGRPLEFPSSNKYKDFDEK